MSCPRERAKLLQAVTYFVTRTTLCGKSKLYWLLYLLDFKGYAACARSVTGLDYNAGADGPVPLRLDGELAAPEHDFVERFHIDNLTLANGRRLLTLHARLPFDGSPFDELERSTLHLLATVHAATDAGAISERAFLPTEPWRSVYERSVRELEPIPYRLARPYAPIASATHSHALLSRATRAG